jgi:pilus assembly protein HofO
MLLPLALMVSFARTTQPGIAAPMPLAAQWQKTLPLRGPAIPLSDTIEAPFSALDFDRPESSLLSWQPSGRGGELALSTDWAAIPALFARLAEHRQGIRGFSIKPEQRRLTLTLQLEAIGDD